MLSNISQLQSFLKECAMESYFNHFPDKAIDELYTCILFRRDPIPDSGYVFFEFFCTNLDCDCDRVLIKVIQIDPNSTQKREVATFGYTWKTVPDELSKAIGLSDEIHNKLPNPYLDPLHQQSAFAQDLMDVWAQMLQNDEAYAYRIIRHYGELRASHGRSDRLDSSAANSMHPLLSRSEILARRKRLAQMTQKRR